MNSLRLGARPGLFIFRRFDFIQVLLGKIAVPDFLVFGTESGIPGRLSARAEQNHVFITRIVELIQLTGGNSHEHTGVKSPRRRIGKVKGALSLDAIELLIGGVLVHGPFDTGVIAVHPGVKVI